MPRDDADMIDDTKGSLRSDYYVYLYRNPMDGKIFYIGKGTRRRAEDLINRNPKTKKMIQKIQDEGKSHIIEYLRYNLDNETAKKYESLAIDLIGIGGPDGLTNKNHGKNPGSRPNRINRASSTDLETLINPDDAKITEPAILIRINQLYRYGMDADSLYDATRGVWVIGGREEGGRRDGVKYAFSVFKGIIMEVYKIEKWYLAGTQATFYKTRPNANKPWKYDPPRWEFEGEIAESNIREKYLTKSVKGLLSANSQNPIKYVNC